MKYFGPHMMSVMGLVAVISTIYAVNTRPSADDAVLRADEAITVAVEVSLRAQAKAREVDLLLSETRFRNERANLTATARRTSQLFADAAGTFRNAAEKVTEAGVASGNEACRTYYTMKRNSLLKLVATAEAAQEGYMIATDETIADRAMMVSKMEPSALRAETTKAESRRLAAAAEAFREEHQAEF